MNLVAPKIKKIKTKSRETESNPRSEIYTTSTEPNPNPNRNRSAELEEQYSLDPNFCNDMNPSEKDSFLLMQKLQQSGKQNVGIEKGLVRMLEKVQEQREENCLMGLAAVRVTAGYMAGVGEHDLSQLEFLKVMEAKHQQKQQKEQNRINKKYEKDLKIFRDGRTAIGKVLLFEDVTESIAEAPDIKTKAAITKKARKEKTWLLGSDYDKLIKYKQLGIDVSLREKIPSKGEDKKDEWHSKYESLPNPNEPPKPTEYEAVEALFALEAVEAKSIHKEEIVQMEDV